MYQKIKNIFPILFVTLLGLNIYVWSLYAEETDRKAHLYAFDVGQGDSFFIKTAVGQDILIDGGPDDKVMQGLGRAMSFGDRKIEVMMVTHPNMDHYEGLKSVLERYEVERVVLTGHNDKNEGWKEFLAKVETEGAEKIIVAKGDRFSFGEGGTFEVFSPEVGKEYKDLNDTSIVGIFTYGETDVLLTGDSVLQAVSGLRDIDILKVPHHGSRHNLDQKTVDILKPEISLIPVGKNSYGHPTKEVLDILNNAKSSILRADEKGTVEVVSDGKEWVIEN